MSAITKKVIRLTPRLIKELRGKRTLSAFAASMGASLVGSLDNAQAEIDTLFSKAIERSARELSE